VNEQTLGVLQMKNSLLVIGVICLSMCLNACQTLHNQDDEQSAMCKEIKSQMLFSRNNTAHQNIAFQQQQDQAKLAQSYHDEGCQ
jgi:hypothetical protein